MKKLLFAAMLLCSCTKSVQSGEYLKGTIVSKDTLVSLTTSYYMTVVYQDDTKDTLNIDIDKATYDTVAPGDTIDVLSVHHYHR